MATQQVTEEARIIKECCEKIENMETGVDIHREVQRIKDCCNKIEQNI